jgi:hypothetical protein
VSLPRGSIVVTSKREPVWAVDDLRHTLLWLSLVMNPAWDLNQEKQALAMTNDEARHVKSSERELLGNV